MGDTAVENVVLSGTEQFDILRYFGFRASFFQTNGEKKKESIKSPKIHTGCFELINTY